MMPDPSDVDDITKSRYKPVLHHKIIAAALHEVEKGAYPRMIFTMPPRAGKSRLAAKSFIPWVMGRDPYRSVIFATYSGTFAEDTGKDVRDTMMLPLYRQVFPGCVLRKGSKASDRIQTEEGGLAVFVGASGPITGRGADFLIVDDPTASGEDASSTILREKQWTWFTGDAMSRLMDGTARVVIITTRWHEDDIVGRLTDPKNKCYNAEEAARWKILSLKALAGENDPLGRKPGESIWPERFPIEALHAQRRLNPKVFSSLYQGSPSPDDGEFFKAEHLVTYQQDELPKNLRFFAASDHAVGLKQTNDLTCLLPVGVDENDHIWILPDVFWQRKDAEVVVDAMINIIRYRRPLFWWAENGHISKSIGPFLTKRMMEEKAFCSILEMTPSKDKMTRAQSIQARMSMKMVHFPAFASWWSDARDQLIKFPSAKHDDFCVTGDALILMADGSEKEIRFVRAGDQVRTPFGTRKVLRSMMTHSHAPVMSWGGLMATPNHPVAVFGGKSIQFVRMDELTLNSRIVTVSAWQNEVRQRQMWSSSWATDIAGIPIPSTNTTVGIGTAPNRVADFCIDTFGSITTSGKSPKDGMSTTRTKTPSTTIFPTWKSSLSGNIVDFTSGSAREPLSILPCWIESDRWLQRGMDLPRGLHGIVKMAGKTGKNENFLPLPASNAGMPLKLTFQGMPGSAGRTANGITGIIGRRPVYNLLVEGDHCYFANGILTHNCDALSWIGIGLNSLHSPTSTKIVDDKQPKEGTLAWIKAQSKFEERQNRHHFADGY